MCGENKHSHNDNHHNVPKNNYIYFICHYHMYHYYVINFTQHNTFFWFMDWNIARMCFREIHSGALCRLFYFCICVWTSKDQTSLIDCSLSSVFDSFLFYCSFTVLSLSHSVSLSACRLLLNVCCFCTLWCHHRLATIVSVTMITCVCPDHLIMSAMFVSPHDAGYVC